MIAFQKSSAVVVALLLCALAGSVTFAADLPSGSAKGSLTFDGATVALTHAAAFVDQKEDGKPVIVLLSDRKLRVEKWESEFDMMFDKSKYNGIVFFLDQEGKVFRTDVHMKDKQTGVSGIFDLKLDNPASKELIGTATATDGKGDKLEATFHATLR